MSYIIHFFFDQQSENVLTGLLRKYEAYAPEVLDQIHFVIVDDCSPIQFEIPKFELNTTWLRVTDAITWNQCGARNLGVVYAKSDKILLCDLDFEFPEHTLRHMIARKNPGKCFYKIIRKGEKGPQNNFFMSRARFLRLYGYDEEFCGAYGAEDHRLVKFLKYHGTWQKYLPKKYYCVANERIDRKKEWHTLDRDDARNSAIDRRKHSELLVWGAETGHSRMFLNFNWKIVSQNFRDKTAVVRPVRRHWKSLWWFRTLFGNYD
ncbi:MAG: glycosyltransferase family 2 protein [Gammaproteobacteria bacterium]